MSYASLNKWYNNNNSSVAILFPPNIDFEHCENKCDSEGRLLVLKIKFQTNTYVQCNIYAPMQDHKLDQNNFSIKSKMN